MGRTLARLKTVLPLMKALEFQPQLQRLIFLRLILMMRRQNKRLPYDPDAPVEDVPLTRMEEEVEVLEGAKEEDVEGV